MSITPTAMAVVMELPFDGTIAVAPEPSDPRIGSSRLVDPGLPIGRERWAATLRLLLRGEPLAGLHMSRREVHAAVGDPDPASLPLAEALSLAVAHLTLTQVYTDLTHAVVTREMARAVSYWTAHDLVTVIEVTPTWVHDWLYSATSRFGGWPAPSDSTVVSRATAGRCFFRCLRALGITQVDPTLDLDLPRRSGLSTRPLTGDEIGLCRLVAAHTLTEHRRPAILALAEATATTTEQPLVRRSHVDLDQARVWLVGNNKRSERWGHLTEWGATVLRSAMRHVPDNPDAPVVYPSQRSVAAGASSVSQAVAQILTDAGLANDPAVRPGSIPAWAGRRVLDETGRIEIVAQRLGVRSLDSAASAIGWQWR